MADILKTYFREIVSDRGMSKEITHETALKAKSGDLQATDLLVKNHLMLVAKIARQYSSKGIDFSDLISEGNAGLMKAIEKWNPEKGASFTTCASWWIKQSIIRNCMHNNRIVRLPEHVSELMRTGRIDFVYGEVNLDQPNAEGNTLSESLPDTPKELFEEERFELLKRTIEKFTSLLKPKEKIVIELHYGLNGKKELDVKEIAEHLSLTTTRINQLLRSSIQKMQSLKNKI
jgi:RNA polymerase sigma factor (sigma-70 family)